MAEPDQTLLLHLLDVFHSADLPIFLFGGWAEELRGLSAPRSHQDIDMLYRASSFEALETFLMRRPEFSEIPAKRFSHKRAVLYREVMIEFILVENSATGPCTHFFDGRLRLTWPAGTFDQALPAANAASTASVTSADALCFYRARHALVEQAYKQYLTDEVYNANT